MKIKVLMRYTVYTLIMAATVKSSLAWAEDGANAPELQAITVTGSGQTPLVLPSLGAGTGATIPNSSFDLFQSPGGTNVYSIVSGLPSVMVQTTDPYGLSSSGPVGVSIRGETSIKGAIGTVEGIPISAIDPGAGQQFLFDSENLRSVSLLTPPFAPEHISVFTQEGYLNRNIRWAADHFGGEVSQSAGSFGFHKTFLRLDSGLLATGTKFFISSSYAHADAWRGNGAAPDYRYNGTFGVTQRITRRLTAKLFAVYDDMKGASYLPLSYAQASNLGANYNLGYNANPQSLNYSGYNQQKFQDYALMGEIRWRTSSHGTLLIKPFYNQENGYTMGTGLPGVKPNQIGYWSINHHLYGVLAKYDFHYAQTKFSLGYWYENIQPPGPPTAVKAFNIAPYGLQFSNWTPLLVNPVSNNVFNSPYFQAKRAFGPVTVTAGVRYLMEQIPTLSVYNGSGVGDVSPSQAIRDAAFKYTIHGHTDYQWLPYIGAVYRLTPHVSLTAAYGRDNGGPALEMWPKLVLSGMPVSAAQNAWNTTRPGTSNAFSLGLAITHTRWYLRPDVFYTTYNHKDIPINVPGTSAFYNQNLGVGKAWGLEIQGAVQPLDDLQVFGSAAYDRAYFTQNIPDGQTILPVSGLQFPDVPKFLATLGLRYRYHRFTVSPVIQYTGLRYADSLHTQPVPAYCITNLNFAYHQPLRHVGELTARLQFLNLFNRHYIGLISQNYVQTGASAATFYPGAPLTVVGSLALRF
ncbi:TonB-dependent receptor [Acidithiobacillus ferridurans]|uniref:TonB-dependent receptor n=1 Tax=Acidithiobacillus ferridurans TaxID=1232575 RepID=UPI001C07C51A|nr:TonB-dependent receptor [Acidithiobacillus ferridurans]MBU2733956.1 TonB-dependent receptor [Acidithiobacillus ferridurans]